MTREECLAQLQATMRGEWRVWKGKDHWEIRIYRIYGYPFHHVTLEGHSLMIAGGESAHYPGGITLHAGHMRQRVNSLEEAILTLRKTYPALVKDPLELLSEV